MHRAAAGLVQCVGGIVAIGSLVSVPLAAHGQSGGYDPIQAGQDAYLYHEARRLEDINNQLGLVEQMKWYSGLPPLGAMGTWSTNGHGAGFYRDPPSLDYIYATGRRSADGYGAWGRGLTPLFGGAYSRDIFSPWPFVPGDIYGYQTYRTVPQSIGQVQVQTGPNRWESHPVYAARPEVPVVEPAYHHDVERELPRLKPRRRPREF